MDMPRGFGSCLFESIVMSHDDALVSVDPQGRISSWNPAAERLFGCAQAQALGQPAQALLARHGLSDPALPCPGSQTLVRDGATLSVRVTRSPIREPGRADAGTLVTVHALQQPASAAEDAAPRPHPANVYESLVEGSDDAIVTKTLSGIVTSWNPGAQRMFGYSAAEMIGEPITKLFPVDRVHEEEMLLQRIACGERVEHFETVRVRKDGRLVEVSVTISPLRDAAGRVVGASKIARDIGERLHAARTIWRQANQDELTQLPNRHAFHQQLCSEVERAAQGGGQFALLYADLDHFKAINDSLGHAAGDALLVGVAQRMRWALRSSDVLARLAGDEFAMLLPALDDPRTAEMVAMKLQAALLLPFSQAEHPIHVSASIGVCVYPRDGRSADELLRHADLAMYEAKHAGRNRTVSFEPAMDRRARGRLLLAGDLRRALRQQELYLLYQPMLRAADRTLAKYEALVRWRHPAFGVVQPARFIALAEESGLILELGDWVFRTAAEQALRWRDASSQPPRVRFNVSPLQLGADSDPTRDWAEHLRRIGLSPDRLVIEVTETVILDDSPRIAQRLGELRQQGFRIAVDDFGTGISNLASLSRIEVDYLKIDQSLIRRLPSEPRRLAICEAIVAMAHRLGLEVIAEGVETEEELARVRDIGCDFAQGYLFAQPLEQAAATDWLYAEGLRQRSPQPGA